MIKFFKILPLIVSLLFFSCKGNRTDKSETSSLNQVVAVDSLPTVTIDDGKPLVIDFSASWCPPCQELKPIFASLTKEYEGKITMVTVDVDENPEMADKFNVESIPTLLFFNSEGECIDRITGLVPEGSLRDEIEKLLVAERK